METILWLIAGVALGALAYAVVERARGRQASNARLAADEAASRIVAEARKDGEAIRKEAEGRAKDILIQAKNERDQESREQRREMAALERRRVEMTYHSFHSRKVKSYVIEPYQVYYAQGGLYVFAGVPAYGEARQFASDSREFLGSHPASGIQRLASYLRQNKDFSPSGGGFRWTPEGVHRTQWNPARSPPPEVHLAVRPSCPQGADQ